MKSLRTRAPLTLGISILAVLGLAACGAQADPGTGSSADTSDAPAEVQPLVAGVIPVTDIGPVYMAQQNGVFEENGFDLTLQPAGSSTEIIQAMQSGQVQIGYGGSTGTFQTDENGGGLVHNSPPGANPEPPHDCQHRLVVHGRHPPN